MIHVYENTTTHSYENVKYAFLCVYYNIINWKHNIIQ